MKPSKRNHDSAREGNNSREEIKEIGHDFEQNENDSDCSIDYEDFQEDFINDPTNQISFISEEDSNKELYYI